MKKAGRTELDFAYLPAYAYPEPPSHPHAKATARKDAMVPPGMSENLMSSASERYPGQRKPAFHQLRSHQIRMIRCIHRKNDTIVFLLKTSLFSVIGKHERSTRKAQKIQIRTSKTYP